MIGNACDRKFDVVGVFVLEELWKAVEEYIKIDEAVRDISEEAVTCFFAVNRNRRFQLTTCSLLASGTGSLKLSGTNGYVNSRPLYNCYQSDIRGKNDVSYVLLDIS
jgi:hypothetical protein